MFQKNREIPPAAARHCASELVYLFDREFREAENTVLIAGGAEPLYLPALRRGVCHQVIFTRDYYASALHEISHWCIAGAERRRQTDYGYWYEPDGRNAVQQAEFEKVEQKPQALEWIFSVAAGFRFQVSLDNLAEALPDAGAFKKRIYDQVGIYLNQGLPRRAEKFARAISEYYGRDFSQADFSLGDL